MMPTNMLRWFRAPRRSMRNQTLTILGAGLLGLMHPPASHATPLDFTFSFSGVTGEIDGLINNATGPATDVFLTNYPAGLEPPDPPITMFTEVNPNTFTVGSGEIQNANFEAFDQAGFLVLTLDSTGLSNLFNESTVVAVFGDAVFTPITTAPVPEPSTWAMLLLGFAGLGFLGYRRGKVIAT